MIFIVSFALVFCYDVIQVNADKYTRFDSGESNYWYPSILLIELG